MVASLLSVVTILGEEMIFTFPDASRGESERSGRRLPRRLPKLTPPPAPDPIAAGRLTAKLGSGAFVRENGFSTVSSGSPGIAPPVEPCAPVRPYFHRPASPANVPPHSIPSSPL